MSWRIPLGGLRRTSITATPAARRPLLPLSLDDARTLLRQMLRVGELRRERLRAMLRLPAHPASTLSDAALVELGARAVLARRLHVSLREAHGRLDQGEELEMLYVPPAETAPPEGIEVEDELRDDDEPHVLAECVVEDDDEPHIEAEQSVEDEDEPHVEAEQDVEDDDEPHVEAEQDVEDDDEPHIEAEQETDDDSVAA